MSRVAVGLDRATDMLAAAVQVPAPEVGGVFCIVGAACPAGTAPPRSEIGASPDAGAATMSSAPVANASDLSLITTAPFRLNPTLEV